ncbi:hypothetical protein BUPH_08271 (plasmid) [Paraburkholderia phenoliruptrix BR3459a]|uniref:Uncharacterized protein n=1 Tax=Paraburkholderia phenoliruptrix BR3459a TaxID=1229205 RepID=K0E1F0_9BURK|nr:hypothetical protein BUPH_08271 [Paraburkholderia phenoliruptrix BR3459a]
MLLPRRRVRKGIRLPEKNGTPSADGDTDDRAHETFAHLRQMRLNSDTQPAALYSAPAPMGRNDVPIFARRNSKLC